ncbi:MAG: calcium-binding protein [Oscillospiraceae bacterium]|nr:calcium-binding protein [Oscillospiraceae bacterium]
MSEIKKDEEREDRIEDEAVVDAYGREERAMGWYYYLADKITFPFTAECFKKIARSPLKVGEKVTVSRMMGEGDWDYGEDMYVEISWNNRKFTVPLAQLKPLDVDDDTLEAIEDWHYWKDRGYLF